ncbi:SsrA-binding protein SmpB [Peptoniphilus sp. KCTC 25270]|uniref:SsrA-binding protein SmpB n=1 Tax=Peptoniphilus sp. KCTC 25270 TaxID=2897414 RepID=UPI001E29FDE8|nr:SsrA-binding protein SmpB [Peptoniphilus sp. KCTC 25270]MCD1147369.1 SsrA-binding protein SmpB [Peptoniphilus sp. KCTC 25270]
MAKKVEKGTLAKNRRATHDYFIEDTYEAGISLVGTEVKSLRQGKANLQEAFCKIKEGEVFIEGMHISPYEQGNIFNVDPLRTRKLLLNRSEIRKLERDIQQKGLTIIPLKLYLSRGRVKVAIATARGKKLYDKRESIAKRDVERRMQQAVRR